jgi:MFS family permease
MEEKPKQPRIALPRKHHSIVTRIVDRWLHTGVIDTDTSTRLTTSISIASFDWQRTARYAFIVAIFCFVIAVGAVLADKVLMELLMRIFSAPAAVKCAFFAAVSAVIFWYGLFLRKKHPHRVYGNESVFFLGVLALAAAVFFLGVAIDTGTGHYSLLFLIASALYALLGLWFPSALVWVFGLLSLGAWMGTETGYVSGHGMYFLGMNYPLRFVIFGGALTILGIAGEHASSQLDSSRFKARLFSMSPQTKVIGLLNLFIALWIMSIFGNYGDMTQWQRVRQYELFHWSLLFGAASIAAVWYGLKRDDGVLRGFGLTFLFINLYTRFFEYFWDSIHKAAFFAVLAASFWYIGSRAEAIWHFGERKLQSNSSGPPTPASGRG